MLCHKLSGNLSIKRSFVYTFFIAAYRRGAAIAQRSWTFDLGDIPEKHSSSLLAFFSLDDPMRSAPL
jgi:hypothetical protein